jgi:hypothetical protein
MKRFKQYLKERLKTGKRGAPAWTESLSTMLFDLPRSGLADLKIPLSPAIFKRIWPESIRSKVFHLTDYDGVGKLKRLQGGKKSISAFYNMDSYIISDRIKTEGGYIVELEGDVLAAAPDDISSQPDKTGRRWLTFSTLMNSSTASDPGLGGKNKLKKMEKDLENLLVDIVTKRSDITPLPNINKAWGYLGKSTGGKEKSIIIKDYIDGMEKIMKKYSKPLRSIFTDYTKKRILDPDEDSGEKAMWDELVVNNFKIQKILVGPEFAADFEDDDDIDGFPFELYDDTGDMADYIARTVQKIKL